MKVTFTLLSGLLLGCVLGSWNSVQASSGAFQSTEAGSAGSEDAILMTSPMMLRFADGSLLWGYAQDHSPESLDFQRLDNSGRVRIPWRLLDPAQSDELKTRFGYVDLSNEEVLIEVDRLFVGDEEIIGKVVNRTETDIVVKTANSLIYVPKLRVRGAVTTVQVPALDVYTKDELYSMELLRTNLEKGDDHVKLAHYCERILAFDRALEHYATAKELGLQTEELNIDVAMATAERKAGAQEQLEYLHQIDSMRARGRFDEALLQAETFEDLFPDSNLFPELAKKQKRVERSREEALGNAVSISWHRWARNLARVSAREMDLEQALEYATEGLAADIRERVLADMKKRIGESVEEDEIINAWVKRRPGRWRKSSFGYGTFLLGETRALAGLQEEDEEEKKKTNNQSEEEKRIAEKIKRYLQNQRTQSRGTRAREAEAEERDLFWRTFPLNSKELWILAYYAEFGGDMELRKPTARNCKECAGSGVREVIYTAAGRSGGDTRGGGGQNSSPRSQKVACPACHHIGIIRRVTYR